MKTKDAKVVFFGTPEMSVWALEEMQTMGLTPTLIVTAPDAKAGRGRVLTPPPVKLWAEKNNIKILQPANIDTRFIAELGNTNWDAFIVFAYGKILPQALLNIPSHGALNIHPSMLPLLRGPSPVRTAIAKDQRDAVGVTIIELDKKMDHGPIVAQARMEVNQWPIRGKILDEMLSREGGKLLSEIFEPWLNKKIIPKPQKHSSATFCHFLKKSDGEILDTDTDYEKYLKYCAYDGWPGTFFFDKNNKRIKITEAHMNKAGKFIIDKVIPEGKKEMKYTTK